VGQGVRVHARAVVAHGDEQPRSGRLVLGPAARRRGGRGLNPQAYKHPGAGSGLQRVVQQFAQGPPDQFGVERGAANARADPRRGAARRGGRR